MRLVCLTLFVALVSGKEFTTPMEAIKSLEHIQAKIKQDKED